MGTETKSNGGLIIRVLAILAGIAAVSGGLWWFLASGGGTASSLGYADKVAKYLPEDCDAFGVVYSPGHVLGRLAEMVNRLRDATEGTEYEFDLEELLGSEDLPESLALLERAMEGESFRASDFRDLGINISHPMGFGLYEMGDYSDEYGVFVVGSDGRGSDERFASAMVDLIEFLEGVELELDVAEVDGTPVTFVMEGSYTLLAVIDSGAVLRVVWSASDVDEVVEDLLDLDADDTLVEDDAYVQFRDLDVESAWAFAVFSHALDDDFVMGPIIDDLEIEFLGVAGGGDQESSTLSYLFGLEDDQSELLEVFPRGSVSLDWLDRVPGEAMAVSAAEFDEEGLLALLDELSGVDVDSDLYIFRDDEVTIQDLAEIVDPEIGSVLLEVDDDDLVAVFDGESLPSVIALRLEDRDEFIELAEQFIEENEYLFDEWDHDEVGEHDIWTWTTYAGESALGVDDQYLWYGDADTVEDVLEGEGQSVRRSSRRLLRQLPNRSGLASVLDAEALIIPLIEYALDDPEVEIPDALEDLLEDALDGLGVVTMSIQREGESVIASATFEGDVLTITNLLGGVIALPAYLRYVKRTMTIEASLNLRRMYDGAVVYFTADLVDMNGDILPPQFPSSAGPTPSFEAYQEECERAGSGPVQVQVDSEEWDEWQDLDFAITDPVRYVYQFESRGLTEDAVFTASAFGDLDCDGVWSTFMRYGEVYQQEVSGPGGLIIMNELE